MSKIKKSKLFILIIWLFCFSELTGQYEMFYVDSTSAFGLNHPVSDISFLATNGNECFDIDYGQVYVYYTDVCITPDSNRYGFHIIQQYDPPVPTGIYKINNPGSSGFGGQAQEEIFENDTLVQGLTCDSTGMMYAAGKGISTILLPGNETYIGDLPPDLHCQGDLTWYRGTLYMVAKGNKFVEVNLQNPSLSEVVWEFTPNVLPIHALATYKIECDSAITYAIGKGEDGSVLYQIDYENQSLIEVCDVPDKLIQGAASHSECSNAPCDIFVDLDYDNSSGGVDNDFISDTTCVPPIAIVDDDVSILSEPGRLDSLTITLSGIIDGVQEFLFCPFDIINDMPVIGSGTNKIKIIDENAVNSTTIFELALETILYQNNASIPSNGTREVTVIAYSTAYSSQPAVSRIIVSNEMLVSNYSVEKPDCFGQNNGALNVNPEGGLAPYSIDWSTGETEENIENLTTGVYVLTLTDDNGCQRADTIELTQPDSLAAIIESLNGDIICDESGELNTITTGGTMPYAYFWSDGFTEQSNSQLPAGSYFVTVTDANDCIAFAEYELVEDTSFVNQQEQICEGEVFDFNDETFDSDTSFCITFLAKNGCDSVHCLILQVADTSYTEFSEEICFGDTYDFNGLLLERDTSVCQIYSNTNGCDSIICLDLTVLENITELNDEFCQGEEYNFNGFDLEQGGIYYDTFPAFNGCDSFIILNLEMYPTPIFSFDIEGNFCLDEEITVTFNPENDYLWETGTTDNILTFTEAGIYNGVATNIFDCKTDVEFIVDEAVDLDIFYIVQEPSCFGDLFGSIIIDTIIGGLSPYQFSLNGAPLQLEAEFENLPIGTYELLTEDNNGCQAVTTVVLSEPQILSVDAGENLTTVLGDTVSLSVTTNIEDPLIQWSPSVNLECDTCLVTYATPQSTTSYQVSVTDANGCTETDNIEIVIDDLMKVYIPTAFSPNNDTNNDYFFIQTNGLVASISTFRIFDRWGSLLFEASNIPPNEEMLGWNGMLNGETLKSDTYVYLIEILRVDGVRKILTGDVFLAR